MNSTQKQYIYYQTTPYSIISFQSLYLLLFITAEILIIILPYYFNIWISSILPLSMLIITLSIKLGIMMFKNKISFKQFITMQLDFTSPYLMVIINIVLGIYAILSIQKYWIFQNNQYLQSHLLALGIISCVDLLVFTVICSLIMHKKTTSKVQFFSILLIIVILTGSSLQQNVRFINSLNSIADTLQDLQNQNLVIFINGKTTQAQYNQIYQLIGDFVSALQTCKDFKLAQIATIIAQLLVLVDIIGRPLQKIQNEKDLNQNLLNNYMRIDKKAQNRQKDIQMLISPQISLRQQMQQYKKAKQIQVELTSINSKKDVFI